MYHLKIQLVDSIEALVIASQQRNEKMAIVNTIVSKIVDDENIQVDYSAFVSDGNNEIVEAFVCMIECPSLHILFDAVKIAEIEENRDQKINRFDNLRYEATHQVFAKIFTSKDFRYEEEYMNDESEIEYIKYSIFYFNDVCIRLKYT